MQHKFCSNTFTEEHKINMSRTDFSISEYIVHRHILWDGIDSIELCWHAPLQ